MRIFNVYGKAKAVLAALTLGGLSMLMASCGGGGVSSNTGLTQGPLAILPGTGTLYGNTPFTITIAGGTRPYFITSNEQTVIPLNNQTVTGNSITVIPNNPGVTDTGQEDDEVPSRSVNITVRDNTGSTVSVTYNVLQNFMTGYGISLNSISSCGLTLAAGESVAGCAGTESLINVVPTSSGLLRTQRQIRFTVNYGPFAYIQADNTTLANTFTMTTDSVGRGTARFIPANNAFTQLASLRATDVETGSYRDIVFLILSAPTTAMTAIPSPLPTLTGSNNAQCGFGSGTVIITGGRPPYTVSATSAFILFTPTVVSNSGGSVSVTYGGGSPPNCASGQLVFTDSTGQVLTVNAPSAAGTTPATQVLSVNPTQVCIPNAAAGSRDVIVSGGNASKAVVSSNPAVATALPTLAASPAVLTINGPAAAPVGSSATITISDGASSVTVAVTRPAVCP